MAKSEQALIKTFEGHSHLVKSVFFSYDAKFFAHFGWYRLKCFENVIQNRLVGEGNDDSLVRKANTLESHESSYSRKWEKIFKKLGIDSKAVAGGLASVEYKLFAHSSGL